MRDEIELYGSMGMIRGRQCQGQRDAIGVWQVSNRLKTLPTARRETHLSTKERGKVNVFYKTRDCLPNNMVFKRKINETLRYFKAI